MSVHDNQQGWTCHGWDDHMRGQLEHARSLTFRQRLERLEEMTTLVGRLTLTSLGGSRDVVPHAETWMVNETAPTQNLMPPL